MILDLKRIFVNENSSLPIEYALDMSGVEFSGTYPLKKPVKISGTVTNKASLTVLDAEIAYEYSAPCDRCGAETAKEYTVKVNKSIPTFHFTNNCGFSTRKTVVKSARAIMI